MVLGSPALDKTQSEGADFERVIDGLHTQRDCLIKEAGKFAVGEHFEGATRRDFDNGGGMKSMALVA